MSEETYESKVVSELILEMDDAKDVRVLNDSFYCAVKILSETYLNYLERLARPNNF